MPKNKTFSDKELGIDLKIDRRDFLNGVSIGVVGSMLSPSLLIAAQALDSDMPRQDQPGYYPPGLNGMRGSHDGSFESAHMARDGENFEAVRAGPRRY